jgi:hypothetical protein
VRFAILATVSVRYDCLREKLDGTRDGFVIGERRYVIFLSLFNSGFVFCAPCGRG